MKYRGYILILVGLVISGCNLDLTEQGRRSAAAKNAQSCYFDGGRLEFKNGDYYCDFSERVPVSTTEYTRYLRAGVPK